MERPLDQAARLLTSGAIVCIPTETFYGLAVLASDGAALRNLSKLKTRAAESAFGLLVPDDACLRQLCSVWPDQARVLSEAFWPGPLTIVVPAARGLAPELIGPGGGVAARVSPDPCVRALLAELGVAITATSANPRGCEPASSVEQAREYFGDEVAFYLDDGERAGVAASTVVSVTTEGKLSVLREGAIAAARVLGAP